jgi:hypothetical protein
VGLRGLGAEVRVRAPPDEEFGALPARVDVPPVPLGPSMRSVATGLVREPYGEAENSHRAVIGLRRRPRDPRTSEGRGPHDPHRRGDAKLLLDTIGMTGTTGTTGTTGQDNPRMSA